MNELNVNKQRELSLICHHNYGYALTEYSVKVTVCSNCTLGLGLGLAVEILYPKTENVNAQMKLKPLWFGLFLILIET